MFRYILPFLTVTNLYLFLKLRSGFGKGWWNFVYVAWSIAWAVLSFTSRPGHAQAEQPVDTYLEEQKKRFGERFTDEELEEYAPEALEIMAKFGREELTRLVAESKNGKKELPSAIKNEAVLAALKKLYNKESDGSSAITWALPPNK